MWTQIASEILIDEKKFFHFLETNFLGLLQDSDWIFKDSQIHE